MIPRRTRFKLAILLALMLPLQGLSAASACGATSAASAPLGHHCAPAAGTIPHHGCGACCAVGVAAAPLNWAAPSLPSPEGSSVNLLPPPDIILDRLDRPPRNSI
jgi:hypothetical protein